MAAMSTKNLVLLNAIVQFLINNFNHLLIRLRRQKNLKFQKLKQKIYNKIMNKLIKRSTIKNTATKTTKEEEGDEKVIAYLLLFHFISIRFNTIRFDVRELIIRYTSFYIRPLHFICQNQNKRRFSFTISFLSFFEFDFIKHLFQL